jgi:hypothetical protein
VCELERKLPSEVKEYMCEEYRQDSLASVDEGSIAEVKKAFSALHYSLCKLSGFGCEPNHLEGLSWLCNSAELGNMQAQALVYRLHESYGLTAPIAPKKLRSWLIGATIHGSLTAQKDLSELDSEMGCKARKGFLSINYGRIGSFILEKRHDILDTFPLQDGALLQQSLLSSQEDVDHGASNVDHPVDAAGHTLLHYASALGYAESVKVLIEMGADVNKVPEIGESALGYACRCGHAAIAVELLERGANAGVTNLYGATPIHYLVYLDDEAVENVARQMMDTDRKLVNANSRPVPTETNYLCEGFYQSGTALHWAVQCDRLKVAKILLELGADPTENDIQYSFDRKNGADVKISPGKFTPNTSPMHSAASLHRYEMLELFIQHMRLLHVGANEIPVGLLRSAMNTSKVEMM